jgi:hypothetical protein
METVQREVAHSLKDLKDEIIIRILMHLEIPEFIKLITSCRKIYEIFNSCPKIFKEYMKFPDWEGEELSALKKWNPNVKQGYYEKAVKRRKQLLLLNCNLNKPRALKILAYKTDGGQSYNDVRHSENYLENIFLNKIQRGACLDKLNHFNYNVTGVILPFTYRKFKKFIDQMPIKEGFSKIEKYGFFTYKLNADCLPIPDKQSNIEKKLPFYADLNKDVYMKYRVDKWYPYMRITGLRIKGLRNYTANTKVYAVYVHTLPISNYDCLTDMNDMKTFDDVKGNDKFPPVVNFKKSSDEVQFIEFKYTREIEKEQSQEELEKPRLLMWIDINSSDRCSSFEYNFNSPIITRFVTLKLIDVGKNPNSTNMDVGKFFIMGHKIQSDFCRVIR